MSAEKPDCGSQGPDASVAARDMPRREFVSVSCAAAGAFGVAALGAGALAGCASLATVPVRPQDGRVRLEIRNHPRLSQPGGSIRLAPEGSAETLFVLAASDGSFTVLSSTCTHLKCTVKLEGDRFVCPCHGSTFDRAGTVLVGPAERPLPRYPSAVTPAGELVIDLRSAA